MNINAIPGISTAYPTTAGTQPQAGSIQQPTLTAQVPPQDVLDALNYGDYNALIQYSLNLPNEPTNGVSVDEIMQGANNAASQMQTTLQDFFSQQGISSNPPVQFKIAADGSVQAYGSPSASQVNTALKNAPAVSDEIQRTIALQGNAEFISEGAVFTEQYQTPMSAKALPRRPLWRSGFQLGRLPAPA